MFTPTLLLGIEQISPIIMAALTPNVLYVPSKNPPQDRDDIDARLSLFDPFAWFTAHLQFTLTSIDGTITGNASAFELTYDSEVDFRESKDFENLCHEAAGDLASKILRIALNEEHGGDDMSKEYLVALVGLLSEKLTGSINLIHWNDNVAIITQEPE